MRLFRRVSTAFSVLMGVVLGGGPPMAMPLTAQDIETVARMRGLTLPQAYYDLVARDSTAFTLPNGFFASGTEVASRAVAVQGTKRMAVIPALFADTQDPHVTSEDLRRAIFDGPALRGTLTEAYLEMSRGRLTVTGEITPWVRTSLTLEEVVGSTYGLGGDARVGEYLVEALSLVDGDMDFSLYDNDGPDGLPSSGDDDGVVDAIAFEFLEVAASCGGPGIWPHLWGISPQNGGEPYTTDDLGPDGEPVTIDAYIVQSAVDCGGVEVQDASVIAHEFGHVLGLPDYYHPTADGGADGRRWVLGCWELMAAGSWGCGPHGPEREPFGPTHLSARSKQRLGWLEYVDVGEVRDHEVVLDPVQQSGQALRVPLDEEGWEFLLLEYRSRAGFDAQLPAEGVMVYHQDFKGQLRPGLDSGLPYFLRVLEQDDNGGLLRNSFEGGNRGEAGDAWGVAGVKRKLNGLTSPSTHTNDGIASSVAIHSLMLEGDVARIRLSTARTPELVAPREPLSVRQLIEFERRIRIAGGYMPYDLEAVVPEGVLARADADDVVLEGALDDVGPFELILRVTDSRGASSPRLIVPLTAGEWIVGEDRLLQSFLRTGAVPLGAAELTYLDYAGNGNGVYDVGDLRAWLQRREGP
jgi:M6 family metalloprotease-like protein